MTKESDDGPAWSDFDLNRSKFLQLVADHADKIATRHLTSKGLGTVAYALDIPQATSRAPHQGPEHKYYRRYNFKAEPMQDDEVRNQIMPVNRRYNIETLLFACDYYAARKKQRLTFEYILIADLNDADVQAYLLARHARRLSAKVNLIPYNTVEDLDWSRPSRNRQEKFLSILRAHKIPATLRREKGHDIDAACGQLRLQTKREVEAGVV